MKLAGGGSAKDMSVLAFIDQASAFEESTQTVMGRLVASGRNQVSTHPVPVLRAKEAMRWGSGPAFIGLMARAAAM